MPQNSKINFPKISIITPCFNQAEFLPFAIESVISQEYPNLEYIIIDGGSTDGSLDIIKQYEDHISYWQSGKDSGQSDAINQGFKKATGDIVAWLNSDDLYLPGAIKHAAECFTSDSQLDLLYGDCVFIDENGQFIRYFTECEPYCPKRIRTYSDFIMQPTTFFKRATLFHIGLLNSSLFYTMDWDLWARFAKADAKVRYTPRVQAANREYDDSKTSSGGIRRLREILFTNLRNMNGFWPNAFFGFMASEIVQQIEKYPPNIRFYSRLMAKAISLMSLNHFVGPKHRALYGIFPHSSKCTVNPEFYLPNYEKQKPKAVKFDFNLNSGETAKVEVYINDVLIYNNYIQPNKDKQMIVPIGSEVQATNCYRVAPRFYINSFPVEPNIISIKLLSNY